MRLKFSRRMYISVAFLLIIGLLIISTKLRESRMIDEISEDSQTTENSHFSRIPISETYQLNWAKLRPKDKTAGGGITVHSAPPLGLRIEAKDLPSLYAFIDEVNGSPYDVTFPIVSPNVDFFESEHLQSICNIEAYPFSECKIAIASSTLYKDDGNRDLYDYALGNRPLIKDGNQNIWGIEYRFSYWVKLDKNQADTWLGWDCSTKPEYSNAVTDKSPLGNFGAHGIKSLQCYQPTRVEKLLSLFNGLEKQHIFLRCGKEMYCESYFLFRRRLVALNRELILGQQKGELRSRLVLSTWHMLNRMRVNAMIVGRNAQEATMATIKEERLLRDGQIQYALCQAGVIERTREKVLLDTVQLVKSLMEPEENKFIEQRQRRKQKSNEAPWPIDTNCHNAGDIALKLAQNSPEQAIAILEGLANLKLPQQQSGLDPRVIYEALISALEASHKAETPKMLQAMASYLAYASRLKKEPTVITIREGSENWYQATPPDYSTLSPELIPVVEKSHKLFRRLGNVFSAEEYRTFIGDLIESYGKLRRDEDAADLYPLWMEIIESRPDANDLELFLPNARLAKHFGKIQDFEKMYAMAVRLVDILQGVNQQDLLRESGNISQREFKIRGATATKIFQEWGLATGNIETARQHIDFIGMTMGQPKGGNEHSSISGEITRPVLRPGKWEITRVFDFNGAPKEFKAIKCTDPISTMQFWDKMIPGCKNLSSSRKGNVYTIIGKCEIVGEVRDNETILTYENESAYKLEETVSGGTGPSRKSYTIAKRIGDC